SGLVRKSEHVGVGRVRFIARCGNRKLMLFTEGDHFASPAEARQKLLVAPRSVDMNIGSEHVHSKLKTHLVIPSSGSSVAENGDSSLTHFGEYSADNHVTGNSSRVPVAPFIQRLGLNHLQASFGERLARGK